MKMPSPAVGGLDVPEQFPRHVFTTLDNFSWTTGALHKQMEGLLSRGHRNQVF